MRLFAVFYQCLSVMHIVLARSSGAKSKVLATSCNTHNIGLQYMIGWYWMSHELSSVLPFSVITNQRFPCSNVAFKADPPWLVTKPSRFGSHLRQEKSPPVQGLGGKIQPPNFSRWKNVRVPRPGDQWSCCHDRRSDPFGRSSTSDAGKALWMFLGTLR